MYWSGIWHLNLRIWKKKKKKKIMNLQHFTNCCVCPTHLWQFVNTENQKNPKFFRMKKENKHHITYILIGRGKKKNFNRKDCRQFFYLMMGPLDTSLGTKPRIRNPTCQNCPSGNPRLRELKLGYLGLGLQIWKGKIER